MAGKQPTQLKSKPQKGVDLLWLNPWNLQQVIHLWIKRPQVKQKVMHLILLMCEYMNSSFKVHQTLKIWRVLRRISYYKYKEQFKTDVDEHINLINTLSDMLGQTAESKMEKFINTMPTIIQTHIITEKTWEKTTDKAKELEHIIRKCDPLAAALPNLTKGAAVPSLYSHIAHSDDKEETLQRGPS